ncbi:hypothetical protein [Ornithinimicrobium kibberense]|uniref:hypothetical protein n=1 Tax=Ornithinimicrobium kibberense TaxID=282060 RepID=UPI00360D840B
MQRSPRRGRFPGTRSRLISIWRDLSVDHPAASTGRRFDVGGDSGPPQAGDRAGSPLPTGLPRCRNGIPVLAWASCEHSPGKDFRTSRSRTCPTPSSSSRPTPSSA